MSQYRIHFILFMVVLLAVLVPVSGVKADVVEVNTELAEDTSTPLSPTTTPTPTNSPTRNADSGGEGASEARYDFLPTTLLDSFDITGTLDTDWVGSTGGYSVAGGQLVVGTGQAIFWRDFNNPLIKFGIDQEASIILNTITYGTGPEIGLILKAQTLLADTDMIVVLYNPAGPNVQVWTHYAQNWVKHGADFPVTFVATDKLSAKATQYGQVEIYKNDVLIDSRNITSWIPYAATGYIGLFNVNTTNTLLDDFSGGSLGASATATPTPTPLPTTIPCTDPLTCNPVSAIHAYWRCSIPVCSGADWVGAAIAWAPSAAYENNGRNGNNGRTVYSSASNQSLNSYMMGSWANGCQITAVSGTVLVIEWVRGTDTWEEFYLNPPQTHTVNLNSPSGQNSVLIEGPDNVTQPFSISLANCTPPPTPTPISTVAIGETTVLTGTPSGGGDVLYAQSATLIERSIIHSLSLFINHAVGQLRLGLYSDSAGNPGTLVAETAEFTPVTGWNKQTVLAQVTLEPGTYWLAVLPQSDFLQFAPQDSGSISYSNQTYGALPTLFPTPITIEGYHFSFYATLFDRTPTSLELTDLKAHSKASFSSFLPIAALLVGGFAAVILIIKQGRKSSPEDFPE